MFFISVEQSSANGEDRMADTPSSTDIPANVTSTDNTSPGHATPPTGNRPFVCIVKLRLNLLFIFLSLFIMLPADLKIEICEKSGMEIQQFNWQQMSIRTPLLHQ